MVSEVFVICVYMPMHTYVSTLSYTLRLRCTKLACQDASDVFRGCMMIDHCVHEAMIGHRGFMMLRNARGAARRHMFTQGLQVQYDMIHLPSMVKHTCKV